MLRTTEARFIVTFCLMMSTWTSMAQDQIETAADENYKLSSFADITFSMTNSVGIGTFMSGYGRAPQWITSFSLDPEIPIPLFDGWPRVSVFGSLGADVWWLSSMQTSVYDTNNRIQFADLQFGLSSPKAFEFPEIGISLSVSMPLTLALSASSRALNRIMAFGIGTGLNWHKGEFAVGYLPSARVWIHSDESKTIDCSDSGDFAGSPLPASPRSPDSAVDQYLLSLVLFRDDEKDENGKCKIAGRQSIWTIKNTVSASWSPGAHRVSMGLSYYWNFLRPLENRPELAGLYSNSSGLTQAVLGRIAYSYSLPFFINTTVTAGVTSYQGIFSKTGALLFPFFDFATPNKNQTQAFVEVATSI